MGHIYNISCILLYAYFALKRYLLSLRYYDETNIQLTVIGQKLMHSNTDTQVLPGRILFLVKLNSYHVYSHKVGILSICTRRQL